MDEKKQGMLKNTNSVSGSEKIKCPKCQSNAVKNGTNSGKQRYRCSDQICRCNFRIPIPAFSTNHKKQRKCIIMYLEGVSVDDIYVALLESVSRQTIRRWIKKYGSALEPIINKKGYAFQALKVTYGKPEIEVNTELVMVVRRGLTLISPMEITPIYFHKRKLKIRE